MDSLLGAKIERLDFSPIKLGDLLHHEGPLLTHFIDRNNPTNHYLYKWADADDTSNRWIAIKVSEDDLRHFLHRHISLRQLLISNAFVYVLDLDNELVPKQLMLVPTGYLPVEYLPTEKSFFDAAHYQPYALKLKASLSSPQFSGVSPDVFHEIQLLRKQQEQTVQLLNNLIKQQPIRTKRKSTKIILEAALQKMAPISRTGKARKTTKPSSKI